MIDLKHEARNFAPMDMPENGGGFSDDVAYAYSLYNKALSYIRKGYYDLARQNLKKAVGLYDDFHPAKMLLGVCYFSNGDRIGAMRMFNNIKEPRYKKLALQYFEYLAEEDEKPSAASGTRLILKDLYRESTRGESKVAEVTGDPVPRNEIYMGGNEPRAPKPEPEFSPEIPSEIQPAISPKAGNGLGAEELGSFYKAEGDNAPENIERPMPVPESDKPGSEFEDEEYIDRDPEFNSESDEDGDDFDVPAFFTREKAVPDVVVTSKKDDGVVEEIVKQKRDEAIKAAKYSGEKKPFSFTGSSRKQIFSENDPEEVVKTEVPKEPEEETNSKRDDLVIAVASIIVIIFMVIISVLLMKNISDNRALRNELENLQRAYSEVSNKEEEPKPSAKVSETIVLPPTAVPGATPVPVVDE